MQMSYTLVSQSDYSAKLQAFGERSTIRIKFIGPDPFDLRATRAG